MKKIIVCYFASILALLGFFLMVNTNHIPFAVMLFAAFIACMLWFVRIVEKQHAEDQKPRHMQPKEKKEQYSIDIPLDESDCDKVKSTIRPGSRQSETYREMMQKRGDDIDGRATNQTAS